jgi:O-antigen ligase
VTRFIAGSRRSTAEPIRIELDLLRVTLFSFIVISISTVQSYVGILRVLRPGFALWALAVVLVVAVPRNVRWQSLGDSWPPKAVLGLAVIACLSVPFGLSMGASGDFLLSVYFRILTLFIVLVAAIRSVRDLNLFVWAFVLSAALLSFLSLTVMDIQASMGGTRVVTMSLYDANDLGMIFVAAVPLGVLLMQTGGRLGRWMAGLSIGMISLGMAVTGSRGAFVGMMIVLPALFIALSHVSLLKRIGLVATMALGLVLTAPEGYWERISTIFRPSEDYNVTDYYGRVEVAKRGLGYMLQYPFFGVGVANFPRAEGTISERARAGGRNQQLRFIAPHNTYVQVGAEMGLGALTLWLGLISAGIFGLWKIRPAARVRALSSPGGFEETFLAHSCTYMPISFLGFACTSYFTSHAYTPVFYIMVALLTGVLTFHNVAHGNVRSSHRRTSTAGAGSRSPAEELLRSGHTL